MIRALYTAASGMTAQQLNLDNIANNLANSSTTGFQQRRLSFSDLLYQNLGDARVGGIRSRRPTSLGLQVGLGVRPTTETETIQTQGDFSTTGNPLRPRHLWRRLLPSSASQRADGPTLAPATFHLDAQGNVVTGRRQCRFSPPITDSSGCNQCNYWQRWYGHGHAAGQTQASQVGSIQMALFINPGGLNSVGNNIYLATTASGDPVIGTPGGADGLGTIQQGMLEESNVSVVDQFVQMIVAQRSYESNSRVVKAADEMLQQLNQLSQ